MGQDSSLSVENPKDVLVSPNGVFSAGFYPIGQNAYGFAIWFSKPPCGGNCTVVWMANRDFPVNGKSSKLLMQKGGNMVLTDAAKSTAWSTDTVSLSPTELHLLNTGNLVLQNKELVILWQSFDWPTDTLLPYQYLTKDTQLVSSRSKTNSSSGFYKLFFDSDNLMKLMYDGPDVSSLYWPDQWLQSWETGRFTYNSSRYASSDAWGMFTSSDNFTFVSADYGVTLQRKLVLDFDGNLRMYGRGLKSSTWVVTWQALSEACRIHGTCGPNSMCSNHPISGRKCSCIPGYKFKDTSNWSYGCEPEFNLTCANDTEVGFLQLIRSEFYGYDYGFYPNYTIQGCQKLCSELCGCKGFQYKLDSRNCYPKSLLLNGRRGPDFAGDIYVKVPKAVLFSDNKAVSASSEMHCSSGLLQPLSRGYTKSKENGTLKFMLWFAVAMGGLEIVIIFLVWCFLIGFREDPDKDTQAYHIAATGFRRFTYSELKMATRNFSEEIGRGAGGVVYRATLSDNRIAAIKKLSVAEHQIEAEFLAEVSTIGKLNHMNLIEIWGYCAEGKHKLLVYEYMEHGSLAENLSTETLDWQKRFRIAVGTARGLAYLHEECLEWVLHCDVKPQNILLDSQYNPKVSDFGLSKLLNRGDQDPSNFSRIRGTRGYMAPEWISNLPITSKVDVYSYGIVLLEIVTGKNPGMNIPVMQGNGGMQVERLVSWARNKKNGTDHGTGLWVEELIDPLLQGEFDKAEMEILVTVALQCVEEDKDARPTMSKVVELLVSQDEINAQAHFPVSHSKSYVLTQGSSLSVENAEEDVIVSPDGVFSAGFYPVGENSYSFAIWFSKPYCNRDCTVVWMANRNFPVNGKKSKLILQKPGNLVLMDAGKSTAWSTGTVSHTTTELHLQNTGNLVLQNKELVILWQSFNFPTDTLLPYQQFTRDTHLVSSRSGTNFSSGFYKLLFDINNVIKLFYDGPEFSSLYWPYPYLLNWETGRFTYNSERAASFDALGKFTSSDNLTFKSADYGMRIQRRLVLDSDGNLRMYSRGEKSFTWVVSWQAITETCRIHGICGPNSVCSYDPISGRKCSCIPGHKRKSVGDWSYGCEPEFNISCGNETEVGFLRITHTEFFGYDYGIYPNYTLQGCQNLCLQLCGCKGIQYRIVNLPEYFEKHTTVTLCFPKTLLLNGQRVPHYEGDTYMKVSKAFLNSDNDQALSGSSFVNCSSALPSPINRGYLKQPQDEKVHVILWFALALGGFEDSCEAKQGYHIAATGFKRFTYSELKKATRNFSEEIGRGAGGIVYKGILCDNRVAAIKRLYVADQSEAVFLAEVSIIGKLNHMNLIQTWGYCVEGKHKLLVYEYMEHGSLAENLSSKALDWQKRFEIAVGTAKGLAYLHEECLEWVLHCDVKPHNILLDSKYQPKVSDFGLSKLLNRDDQDPSNFSRIRGTRGYMAPEWISNLPITSKVDVYSFGIVVLEMVTGKCPSMSGANMMKCGGDVEYGRLVSWVRDKKHGTNGKTSWIEEIIDPTFHGEYDKSKMEFLVTVALQCVEEDSTARPAMSKVVEQLCPMKISF
ncbi:hypothetical protein Tsubulata_029019, partial [Turnera subulata]